MLCVCVAFSCYLGKISCLLLGALCFFFNEKIFHLDGHEQVAVELVMMLFAVGCWFSETLRFNCLIMMACFQIVKIACGNVRHTHVQTCIHTSADEFIDNLQQLLQQLCYDRKYLVLPMDLAMTYDQWKTGIW